MTTTEVRGTCHHDCPDSCGWVATVTDGVAVKLRGNPEHPFSQGELCPKVNKFLDRVYSDERILHPLIRTGTKGSGEFRQASWDEALALVADRWRSIIATSGGEAIAPWVDAGTQGLLQQSSLDRRLLARMGATQLTGSLCGQTTGWGTVATYGTPHGADPVMVRHAELILLWGTNTLITNRHLWPFIEEARAKGAQVVVIDPFRTMTAERADWFIQPHMGTDVALMLAMMHVLIRDGLIDRAYIDAHTNGFDELAAHVAGSTPEWAAAECGVPADEIERLARAYGGAQPAMIRTLIGPEHHTNGGMFFRTMACLPLLTGSWKHKGGGMARSVHSVSNSSIDFDSFDAPELVPSAPDGAGPVSRRSYNMNHLGRLLTDTELDPPIESLLVWNGNPLTSVPSAHLTRRGLERDDLFVVVSEQLMTDTARYADVIFPATTQLEQRDVVTAWGHLWIGWNEAAIEPLGESVPNTELWRRLAAVMGYDDPALFATDDELLAAAMARVDLDAMKRDGWVWSNVDRDYQPYADGGFGFPDGKAQFVSSMLEAQGLDALPTYHRPPESPGADDRYPLTLHTPKFHSRFLNTSYSPLPGHGDRETGPFLEISAGDAAERNIVDGDRVRIYNDRSEIVVPARISDRVRSGMVAVPFGWWDNTFGGRSNVNDLTNDELTDFGGGVAYHDTLVQAEAVPVPGTS